MTDQLDQKPLEEYAWSTFRLVRIMASKQSNTTEKKPVFSGRLTLKAVNKALAEEGASEILVRGHGFHYFTQGSTARWPTSLVMKPRLADYTLEQWVIVWRNMRDDHVRNQHMSYFGNLDEYRTIPA